MSDFEDEMEVDAPPVHIDIQFSGDNTASKGKRSAANLPVEAEDTLPWYCHPQILDSNLDGLLITTRVEKYRPNSLDDVEGHQDILATINRFVETNRLPHLLLYGPPGTGKTSTVLALARRIYGAKNMRQMVLELNASDDRGIEVVRYVIESPLPLLLPNSLRCKSNSILGSKSKPSPPPNKSSLPRQPKRPQQAPLPQTSS